MIARRILVVDDEPGVRAALSQLLEFEGYEVKTVGGAAPAFDAIAQWRPDLVFLDVKMAGMDGLEALREIRTRDPLALVVMISGHATIQTAVGATQLGAYDILEKPLDTDRILVLLRNALATRALREEVTTLRARIASRWAIVGTSFAVRALLEQVERVGPTQARVLITGENGTGMELVARALHTRSTRSAAPFVEVNCAAIPSELIESELFGHMRGSFTGATQDRAGKFEQADGGTIFLDEIGDMALAAQAKVLRVLEDGEVTRIGGAKSRKIDVRVLAATNKDLLQEIADRNFREDLYHRLSVILIQVPSLNDRREDIPELIQKFLNDIAADYGNKPKKIDGSALEYLKGLDWRGNIRELRNVVERLVIMSDDTISADDAKAFAGK